MIFGRLAAGSSTYIPPQTVTIASKYKDPFAWDQDIHFSDGREILSKIGIVEYNELVRIASRLPSCIAMMICEYVPGNARCSLRECYEQHSELSHYISICNIGDTCLLCGTWLGLYPRLHEKSCPYWLPILCNADLCRSRSTHLAHLCTSAGRPLNGVELMD